jgi:hypothetical protein
MKNNLHLTILVCVFLMFSGIIILPFGTENAFAETWTETNYSDFIAGEKAFVDVLGGSLELSNGLERTWSDYAEAVGDIYGDSIDSAGDVNGDGFDDVIISASQNDDGGTNAGKVYVYYGSSNGLSEFPDWTAVGEAATDFFGGSVAGVGDVNGDGYDDVVIGAENNDGAGTNAGEVYLFLGSKFGLKSTPSWSDQGEVAGDLFGYTVAGAGDVNGDGYFDVLVGARWNDGGGTSSGEAYLYFGSSSGLSASPDWSKQGEAASDEFSRSIAGAGDLNGDGYDDVIIGAFSNDDGGTNAGKAYVYFGSSSGLSTIPDWNVTGEGAGDLLALSVSGAGDLNGDGYDEILIGAPQNDGSGSNAGKVYLFLGSASGPSGTVDWSFQGETAADQLGGSVASAGDVNNDGYDDIIMGAQYNDDHGGNAGKTYLYFGGPRNGPMRAILLVIISAEQLPVQVM